MMLDHPPPGISVWRCEAALVVALAGHGVDLSRFDLSAGWEDLTPVGTRSPWTDQRSDILRAIRFGL
jgi:hypothetical protein